MRPYSTRGSSTTLRDARALLQSDVCKMLDPGKPCFAPKKGKTSVVMLVGLQGTLFINLFSCLLDHSAIVTYNLTHIINGIVLWEVGIL